MLRSLATRHQGIICQAWYSKYCFMQQWCFLSHQSLSLILCECLVIHWQLKKLCNCLAFSISGFCVLSNIWCRLNIDFYTFWNTVKNVPLSQITWGVAGGHSSFPLFYFYNLTHEMWNITICTCSPPIFQLFECSESFSQMTCPQHSNGTPLNLLSTALKAIYDKEKIDNLPESMSCWFARHAYPNSPAPYQIGVGLFDWERSPFWSPKD